MGRESEGCERSEKVGCERGGKRVRSIIEGEKKGGMRE